MDDADGGDTMGREQFRYAMFQLVDLWVDGIDPDDYVKFLDALLYSCAATPPWPPEEWKPTGLIRPLTFDGIANFVVPKRVLKETQLIKAKAKLSKVKDKEKDRIKEKYELLSRQEADAAAKRRRERLQKHTEKVLDETSAVLAERKCEMPPATRPTRFSRAASAELPPTHLRATRWPCASSSGRVLTKHFLTASFSQPTCALFLSPPPSFCPGLRLRPSGSGRSASARRRP